MRCTAILAAAIGGFCVSSSFAGFTVTATKVAVAGFDRYDVVAVNDGVGTGTQVKGLEYFYNGAPAAFEVTDTTDTVGGDPDGINDTVNLLSTTRTRLRVSTTGANNVFVGVSPSNGFAQPNPYDGGASQFSGAIANTGTTQASGAGFQIARIFLPTGGSGVLSGNLGGDLGLKVPFLAVLGGVQNVAPVIVPPSQTVNVVFGAIVSSGAPFSANVTVTDANATDVLSLALGALPAGVTASVSGATGVSPRSFTISGVVDYSNNGTDVVIPLLASDGQGGTGTGTITLHVTPEPASLGLVGLSSLLMGRRRK